MLLHFQPVAPLNTQATHALCRQPHWLVVDGLQGGSGESFDWGELRLQASGFAAYSSHGWLLAGGLTPDSVAGEQAADNMWLAGACDSAPPAAWMLAGPVF
jgi:phosphoribosylanthranilate isomerase